MAKYIIIPTRNFKEIFARKKLLISIIILAIVIAVIVLTVFTGGKAEHPIQSKQESLPVSAKIEEQRIIFDTEVVKPLQNGQSYFVNYRLQREQSRQEAKAMLEPLLNSNLAKAKEQAQLKWLELTKKIEKEGEIENLLKIKGFQDAVADVNQESVSIIIYASSLTPNQVNMIQDIVVKSTKVRLDKITISCRK